MDQIYILSSPLEPGTDTRNREAASACPPAHPLARPPRPPAGLAPPLTAPPPAITQIARFRRPAVIYRYGRFVYEGPVITEPVLGLEYLPGVLQGIREARALRARARVHKLLCGPTVTTLPRPLTASARPAPSPPVRRGCAGPDPLRLRGARAAGRRRAHPGAGVRGE